ncbi:EF-hand domain-containing protein [Dyella acidiphila]|uniref:EF-hand domain-containing protein n=1 Tax=Dyella acidiphila TaxID=2775866 RepID=A0ABR9G4X7_9GAMM|nr:EF-hand domain-containing protein [Dyella acidiphila]MBE1159091.1 EF-hand domain-containing protein [Dyella acidiphila]
MNRCARMLPLLLLTTLLPLAGMAQTGLNETARSVKALDKNFDAADKNHDGLLTRDEAQTGQVPFIANNFDAIDTHHRGAVSKQDVHAYIAAKLTQSQTPASAASAGAIHP